jgi:Ran GTPase-activating protein (RanGAP) involved in mRNA processing and transport
MSCLVSSRLRITGAQLTDMEVDILADALRRNSTVESLDLSNNALRADACRSLQQTFRSNTCSLTSLCLDNTKIGDEGVVLLLDAIAESQLEYLSVRSCRITTAGCEAVSNIATDRQKRPRNLKALLLGGNMLKDDGLTALRPLFSQSVGLQLLELAHVGATDKGAEALAAAMSDAMLYLLTLDLGGNQIGRDGQSALVRAIQKHQTLLHFRVADWEIASSEITALRLLGTYGFASVQ